MLGGVIVYREVNGMTLMCNRPRKRNQLTPHQKAIRARFLLAVAYARDKMKDPDAKAAYAAGITSAKTNAYTVALTDYLTPPKVETIDISQYRGAIGDMVVIHATDDFKVASVQVAIYNPEGALLEKGDAIPGEERPVWLYATTTSGADLPGTRFVAVARDNAGNTGTNEVIL